MELSIIFSEDDFFVHKLNVIYHVIYEKRKNTFGIIEIAYTRNGIYR